MVSRVEGVFDDYLLARMERMMDERKLCMYKSQSLHMRSVWRYISTFIVQITCEHGYMGRPSSPFVCIVTNNENGETDNCNGKGNCNRSEILNVWRC